MGQKWNLPDGLQAEGYSEKLRLKLAEPFQPKQLADMWELANHRKPLLRLRQTRGRTVHVPTNDEGLSYLDHHPGMKLTYNLFFSHLTICEEPPKIHLKFIKQLHYTSCFSFVDVLLLHQTDLGPPSDRILCPCGGVCNSFSVCTFASRELIPST